MTTSGVIPSITFLTYTSTSANFKVSVSPANLAHPATYSYRFVLRALRSRAEVLYDQIKIVCSLHFVIIGSEAEVLASDWRQRWFVLAKVVWRAYLKVSVCAFTFACFYRCMYV
jgi:hypothetical protein